MNADRKAVFLWRVLEGGRRILAALGEVGGEPVIFVSDPDSTNQPSAEDVAYIKQKKTTQKVWVEGCERRVYIAVILEFVSRAA